jgi:curved DNA-binding protein CbpA
MVSSKDYYGILQVPPTASLEEIKKAYRKLALLYHPDTTTATSDIALHRFSEIKEAYQVLSNSSKRQEYHYKKFYTDYKAHVLVTPEIILLQIKELAALIAVLNPFRINYDTLYHQIILLLNDISISILQKKNNRNLIESIVKNALTCTRVLPYHYAVTILQTLLTLVNGDEQWWH